MAPVLVAPPRARTAAGLYVPVVGGPVFGIVLGGLHDLVLRPADTL